MKNYMKGSIELNSIWENNCQYPTIAVDNEDRSYVVYQEHKNHVERICLHILVDGVPSKGIIVSGTGLALCPAIHYFENKITICWSEYENNQWSICYRQYQEGKMEDIVTIAKGSALFYPSVSNDGKNFVILFNEQGVGYSNTYLYTLTENPTLVKINDSRKTYRPSFVADKKGQLFCAYDSFNGKSYDLLVKVFSQGSWSKEFKINQSGNRCAQPVLALANKDVVVVGWYENGSSSYFSYNVVDLEYGQGKLIFSNYQVLLENRNWYNNVAITHNANGSVVFAYTIGKYNLLARVRNLDGSWGHSVLLSYNDGHCCVRPKLALANNDRLHYVWQFSKKNGHQVRNAVTVYNQVLLNEIATENDDELGFKVDEFVQPIDTPKYSNYVDENRKKAWLKKNDLEDFKLLFGDIHGQSNMSDGMGEIDQYYHYAMVDSHMDFCALTDHDCYPDEATDSEWEWNRATRNVFDGEPNFTALLAYEWTSNEYNHDFGHKNVYYPSSKGSLFTSVDEKGLNPDRLYKNIKAEGGQCIPHHPAANWTMVSAATDWDYHDEEVERLMEIFSRHADYEKTSALSKYTKNIAKFDRHCAQDALKRGYHLGFTAGSDSHQMEHGKEGGIVAAFMKEQSSEALWNAMYKRQVYATTGSRILLNFMINDVCMGKEIASATDLAFKISVLAPAPLKKVEVIKNGEVIKLFELSGDSLDEIFTIENTEGNDYYYTRVEQQDEQCAWSSPIWVE